MVSKVTSKEKILNYKTLFAIGLPPSLKIFSVKNSLTGCWYVYCNESDVEPSRISYWIKHNITACLKKILASHPSHIFAWQLAYERYSGIDNHADYYNILQNEQAGLFSYHHIRQTNVKISDDADRDRQHQAIIELHAKYNKLDNLHKV